MKADVDHLHDEANPGEFPLLYVGPFQVTDRFLPRCLGTATDRKTSQTPTAPKLKA